VVLTSKSPLPSEIALNDEYLCKYFVDSKFLWMTLLQPVCIESFIFIWALVDLLLWAKQKFSPNWSDTKDEIFSKAICYVVASNEFKTQMKDLQKLHSKHSLCVERIN